MLTDQDLEQILAPYRNEHLYLVEQNLFTKAHISYSRKTELSRFCISVYPTDNNTVNPFHFDFNSNITREELLAVLDKFIVLLPENELTDALYGNTEE